MTMTMMMILRLPSLPLMTCPRNASRWRILRSFFSPLLFIRPVLKLTVLSLFHFTVHIFTPPLESYFFLAHHYLHRSHSIVFLLPVELVHLTTSTVDKSSQIAIGIMLGLMNDCLEKLVISKFGVGVWESVKTEAGCDVKNDGFLKLEKYHDDATVVLIECISEQTGLEMDEVYRLYGAFFVEYIMDEGYDNLLYCQGRTLKEWLAGINAMHNHLQTTFPNKIEAPELWVEENYDGTLTLFYMSSRAADWAPYTQGLVAECAKCQFGLDLKMELVSVQGSEGARFTSWVLATECPDDLWKLRASKGQGESDSLFAGGRTSCPFSGMVITTMSEENSEKGNHDSAATLETTSVTEISLVDKSAPGPFGGAASGRRGSGSSSKLLSIGSSQGVRSLASGSNDEGTSSCNGRYESGSLSASTTRKLFPYHVVIDQDFSVMQVGLKLSNTLGTKDSILYNYDVDEIFQFVQPKQAKWTRSWMRKLEDQEFSLKCILNSAPDNVLFKGTLLATNPGEALLVLCPEANNLEELREMKLTMSDLPAHGAYRDAIFLREHLSKQLNNALRMEKLSKTLQTEKELLESLLPKHAADGLRKGESVTPRIHHNVTMFFSDIVGFTNISKHVDPREVVDMLNRLYMVMDHLAKKFGLFKIETIGDAYVAASGLPDADPMHAINVANFAIAVTHISKRVLSPLDGKPIKLRIGVNSGRCCSGIVGVTNPRYCVFGDTVNTTARHESTGEAGRVHSSMTTMIELLKQAPDEFVNESRGMVEMKGKGHVPTYWLSSTQENLQTNKQALEALEAEVTTKFGDMLKQETCLARRKMKAKAKSTGEEAQAPISTKAVSLAEEPATIPFTSNGGIEMNSSGSFDESGSATESAVSSSDFGSSFASTPSSGMPSPIGVSGRSSYTPSKFELLQMLGHFIDGDAEYEDILQKSARESNARQDNTEDHLTDTVDEALRVLDEDGDI